VAVIRILYPHMADNAAAVVVPPEPAEAKA
jgi:hypothetical protein